MEWVMEIETSVTSRFPRPPFGRKPRHCSQTPVETTPQPLIQLGSQVGHHPEYHQYQYNLQTPHHNRHHFQPFLFDAKAPSALQPYGEPRWRQAMIEQYPFDSVKYN